MIEERYIDLMNREIDHVNSKAESAELGRYLESSGEARAYYDQLRDLAAAFERAGQVEPPEELDQIILSSIAARDAERAASKDRFSIRGFMHSRRKLAYAFATGVAAGLIIMAIVYRSPAGTSSPGAADLYGALAERSKVGALFSVEPTRIDEPGVSGTVEVRYLEHAVQVVLALVAGNEIKIDLTPAGGLALVGFRAHVPGPYGLEASGENIEITFTGRCDDALLFADERGAHPPVALRISSAGKVMFEKMIEPGRNE